MHYSITLYNILYGSKKWYANLHNEQIQIGIYICTCIIVLKSKDGKYFKPFTSTKEKAKWHSITRDSSSNIYGEKEFYDLRTPNISFFTDCRFGEERCAIVHTPQNAPKIIFGELLSPYVPTLPFWTGGSHFERAAPPVLLFLPAVSHFEIILAWM